ncbi:hypothetical protein [Stenotrophomonas maltophilia]|uniref:hypothetical protein n=1 Tax=Stenotrophomonas maltophilia TaxID=40324 RepID=UPI0021C5B7B2|nr:hypothetical protein [Stenotrophomonas maltophilia]MCU1012464.1 hypothetical protein [Stenotrophomonas maltophilia]
MNRDFAANLVSYLELSSAWLIDTMRAHDMAVATAKIVESLGAIQLMAPPQNHTKSLAGSTPMTNAKCLRKW